MPRIDRDQLLRGAAWVAVFVGAAVRLYYAIWNHHPRHTVVSDAAAYLDLAHKLLDSPGAQALSDTIWPPGVSALWALAFAADGSLELAALVNWMASVLVVVLCGLSARLIAGTRAGYVALLIASLHLGFIHYTGYFLAEQPSQFATALAIWLSLRALRVHVDLRDVPARRAPRLFAGAAAGVAWALSALLRPNALPVLASAALALAVYFGRARDRPARWLGIGLVLGASLVFAPAADRCTRLARQGACLVSNNIAMNVALGQAGTLQGLVFEDPARPGDTTSWVPPALLHHGYTGMGRVPATIYDTPGVLRWVWGRFTDDPGLFFVRALGNVFDLFGLAYWPDGYGKLSIRAAVVAKQLFFALALIPALVSLVLASRRSFAAGARARSTAVFVLAALGGVALSAAVSLGEARYRMPFDALLIALASALYAGVGDWVEREPALPTRARGGWLVAGSLALLGALLLLAVAHPRIGLGQALGQRSAPLAEAGVDDGELARFAAVVPAGAAWDAAGAHRFACRPDCRELRFGLPAQRKAVRVELSVDANDRYRVLFYRAGRLLAHVDVPAARFSQGLRPSIVATPAAARDGFDAVGVLPLYGDGRYSIGRLALVDGPASLESAAFEGP